MSRKTFGCYQQEPFNLHWENYVSDGSQCIVSNRMFRMQRRRESKKSNSLTRENNDFARAVSQFFVHFLCRHCTTTTWKCLMSRFMKDLNKQCQNFLSLYELGYGWQKFSSRRVRLYLTKYASWNNHDKDWKNVNSLFMRRFRGCQLSWHLKLPNIYEGVIDESVYTCCKFKLVFLEKRL